MDFSGFRLHEITSFEYRNNSQLLEVYLVHGRDSVYNFSQVSYSVPLLVSVLFLSTVVNIMVKWLTHWFQIWEVLGSNLGPETSYLDGDFFVGFPQSLQANAVIVPFIREPG
jgi:hypothetical protein